MCAWLDDDDDDDDDDDNDNALIPSAVSSFISHTHRLAIVEQRIRALNPLAQLHRTRYCDVPLQCVLDVDLPTDGGAEGAAAAMTHEVHGRMERVSVRMDGWLLLS